jgi:alkyldihydroxyacetonephosphate synthase
MGLTPLPGAIVEHWLGHRNHVNPWDFILDRGIVADTVEISATWDRIAGIYDAAVRRAESDPRLPRRLRPQQPRLSERPEPLLHLRQSNPLIPKDMEAVYFEALAAHPDRHRRRGRQPLPSPRRRPRPPRLDAPRARRGRARPPPRVKAALDPYGIMNPGVLLPDA